MTDDKRRKEPKSIGSIVKEFWQGVVDTLESLVSPEPVPIPVPIRNPRRR